MPAGPANRSTAGLPDRVEEPRGLREFALAADDGRVHGPMQCMACDGGVGGLGDEA